MPIYLLSKTTTPQELHSLPSISIFTKDRGLSNYFYDVFQRSFCNKLIEKIEKILNNDKVQPLLASLPHHEISNVGKTEQFAFASITVV